MHSDTPMPAPTMIPAIWPVVRLESEFPPPKPDSGSKDRVTEADAVWEAEMTADLDGEVEASTTPPVDGDIDGVTITTETLTDGVIDWLEPVDGDDDGSTADADAVSDMLALLLGAT